MSNEPVSPLLEVVTLHPSDAGPAQEGGADRLYVTDAIDSGGLSPEPAVVSTICRESDIAVRVMLRLNDTFTTNGGELARLIGLAQDYVAVGAEGVIFGFLDADLLVDVEVCTAITDALPGVPWTFHRAIDSSLETKRAWRQLGELAGLDAVLSAGSTRGLAAGYEELTERASGSPSIARLLMPGGGLAGEHVPWLLHAGVRQFHVGKSVRPSGSWKAYVDSRHVRAWRLLLDDAVTRRR
ncbi:MAG TPA: copper homeostasis protein CutC [Nocardioidaceae bacterium]|nr:copper homeostasis protein CutC [Nocardioidaceae bacterium]